MSRHLIISRAAISGVSAGLLLLGAAATAQRPVPVPPGANTVVPEKLKNYVPVSEDMLLKPRPENWISYRNGYPLWGYSSLNQINARNVKGLQLVWSRSMQPGPQEMEPIVYNGVMFLVNSDDIVQALDAATGDLLWEYRRQLPPNIGRLTGTLMRYRNISIFDDKIYLATQDAFQVALDAKTGKLLWETKRADYKEEVAQTTGPIVVKGKLINGSRCDTSSPRPGGCFISAIDARHGEPLWTLDVVAKPGEPGGDTWGDLPLEQRRHSSAWMLGSYDPALNLLFWGTGVTAPTPEKLRGSGKADLLYTNSTLAINPDTGERVWYYQHLPRDNWDLDHTFERFVVETQISPDRNEVPWINPKIKPGETRKVVTGIPGKTGIVYTLDAKTGEFLWARPTIFQNVISSINPETGRPTINEESTPQSVDKPSFACPHNLGGKNQPSGAYHPGTNAMYMGMNETCMDIAMAAEKATLRMGYAQSSRMRHAPGGDPATTPIGRFQAVSASTGKTLWTYRQRAPFFGSALTTGGNLAFIGDVSRRFRAFNAETGAILWETILNGSVGSRPMTFSVNGRQYLAVGAGGESLGQGIMSSLAPEIPAPPRGGNTLFVFALPQ